MPAAFGVVMIAGVLWALMLRAGRKQVYEGIGYGARSAAATTPGGFSAAMAGPDDDDREILR